MPFRFLILGALLLISCKRKVDCDAFSARVEKCAPEFGARLAPGKPYDSTRLSTLLDTKLLKSCRSRGGKVGDAGKINSCLEKSGCPAFAECILGPKGEKK